MEPSYFSLVPAIVTIIVALATRKVALALFSGIVGGAIVMCNYSILEFGRKLLEFITASFTDIERFKIVLFILLIGGLLEIINGSGAYNKFAQTLSTKLNTSRKSRLATWAISMTLFFDDYANVLISGASMRSINIKNKVSPAIIAYIVDVVAIMASIMIISTWASFEGSVMVDAGKEVAVNKSMSLFFIESLPYHLYTYLAIFLTFLVAYSGKWFGSKMDKDPLPVINVNERLSPKLKLSHVLAPILTLILFAIIGLFVSGTYILSAANKPITLINILGSAPSVEILIIGTILSIIVAVFLISRDTLLKPKQIIVRFKAGTFSMVGVSLVILLATGLSVVSDQLGTGIYITQSVSGFVTPEIIPVMVFVVSMLITVATGFSWSSMAIVMPIAYQMVIANGIPDALPAISAAVISGAVSGEHMIPFSEKAVMSAAATKIKPVYHIKTMFFQTLTVFIAASFGYWLYGMGVYLWLVYIISASLITAVHILFAKKSKQLADN